MQFVGHALALALFGQGERLGHGAQPGLGVKQLCVRVFTNRSAVSWNRVSASLRSCTAAASARAMTVVTARKACPSKSASFSESVVKGPRPLIVPHVAQPANEDSERGGLPGTKVERRPNQDGHEHELKRILVCRMDEGPKIASQVTRSTRKRKAELELFPAGPLNAGTLCPQEMAGVTIRIPVASPIHHVSQMMAYSSGNA